VAVCEQANIIFVDLCDWQVNVERRLTLQAEHFYVADKTNNFDGTRAGVVSSMFIRAPTASPFGLHAHKTLDE
jgi:hypothetical protein